MSHYTNLQFKTLFPTLTSYAVRIDGKNSFTTGDVAPQHLDSQYNGWYCFVDEDQRDHFIDNVSFGRKRYPAYAH